MASINKELLIGNAANISLLAASKDILKVG